MNAVENLHEQMAEIAIRVTGLDDISLSSTLQALHAKTLLLSVASYFETKLTTVVRDFCKGRFAYLSIVPNIIEMKAINRQYHTWFDWKSPSAGPFFAMFGKQFVSHMKELIRADEALEQQISAFLRIGADRNLLVHNDYAAYYLESTADEIYSRYQIANGFVQRLPTILIDFELQCQGLREELR